MALSDYFRLKAISSWSSFSNDDFKRRIIKTNCNFIYIAL